MRVNLRSLDLNLLIAQRYAPGFGLTVNPVPLKMQVAPVTMVWSARADREAGSLWLRNQIQQILVGYAEPTEKVLNGCHPGPKARVRTAVPKKKG